MAAMTVREAKRSDCREILRLIEELSVFEKAPHGPNINEKDLERDAFDVDHPFFFCYVIEDPRDESKLIAYAMCYYTYGTWTGKRLYLRDLYVTETYRGKGIGNLLFKKVVQKAEETNCTDMAWTVLNWNPATDFYKARGARDMTEAEAWHVFRLGPESMKSVAGKI
ncbi:diamine acetyltransferase 2-like [Thrips palmi]|uniref:Diamine acetyltransferase 2-like n=1 Tax=Thrips palmi TaxID=161013 RepID=A0A6P8ZNI0_THRPL|nr:diamine acetyltransferase 2-like [Thrips palmi]